MSLFKSAIIAAICCACLMFTVSAPAQADVTYQLGEETDLLDAAFYAGEASDGSNVAGRMAGLGRVSNSGTTVAFWVVNANTFGSSIFLVDIGDPSSWRRLTNDTSDLPTNPICWTPDDSALYVRFSFIPIATGQPQSITVHGYGLFRANATAFSTGNWILNMVYTGPDSVHCTVALPILPNGREDLSREPVQITNLLSAHINTDWPCWSADGTMVAFNDWTRSVDGIAADTSDVYVLKNVPNIIGAPKISGTDISELAPTSATDPNLVSIRVDESVNNAGGCFFSADGSLVIYSEDWNNVVRDNDFWGTLALADYDIMISQSDGSGSDLRLERTGSQLVPIPTPGGTRIIYTNNNTGSFRTYITTLTVATTVTGETVGDPEDNDILTTTAQQSSDASGTTVAIPEGTTVNFPAGVDQQIEIFTPIDPATEPELPSGVDAIPVIRSFGPEGTVFDEPITITITYTDAEIEGLDEANLRVFLYNTDTGVYDIEVTSITNRDLANNTVSFTVDHFSQYGLGGYAIPMPVAGLIGMAGIALGLSLLGYHYVRRALRRS